jgi:hypothetical protein
MGKMNMATDPNLDAILYLEREQAKNDLVEVFVLEIEGCL